MLPHAYQKINVVFLFIGKLEWFSNSRFVLLLNEYCFHKQHSNRGLQEVPQEVFLWTACTGIIFLGRGFPGAVTELLM